jgi:GlpG protein
MRKIGTLPTQDEANRFSDFLYVKEIENTTEPDEDGGCVEIWVHDDAQLEAAKKHLEYFIANPIADDFDASNIAERKRKDEAKADARRKSRVINRERMDYERNFAGFAIVPLILGILSIVATLLAGRFEIIPSKSDFDSMAAEEARTERFLAISMTKLREPDIQDLPEFIEQLENPKSLLRLMTDLSLPEVREGQVWRLITPIFVHFGVLHIVFNMMWLRDLGGFFQNRFGVRHLVLFVLIVGTLSNYSQLWMSGPYFGGMSGVNYGLFGFLWMRGKHDRFAAWQISPMIVQTMLVWFFVCLVGLIPNVANTAHAAGLLAGMAWGYFSAKRSSGAF